MDPVTIGVGALLVVFTTAGGFIFARQESRIATLEAQVAQLSREHLDCETNRVRLEEKVAHLEAELAKLKGTA